MLSAINVGNTSMRSVYAIIGTDVMLEETIKISDDCTYTHIYYENCLINGGKHIEAML